MGGARFAVVTSAHYSEDVLRQLGDVVPCGVCALDAGGVVVWSSAKVEQLGWDAQRLRGETLWSLIDPADRDSFTSTFADVLAGDSARRVTRLRDPRDQWREVRISLSPWPDANGDVEHCVAIVEAIDEEVRERAALLESQERYRLVAETSSDVVFSLDAHRAITWISPSVRAELGYRPDEMVGHFIGDFVFPDDLAGASQRYADLLERGRLNYEVRLVNASGTPMWFNFMIRVSRDAQGGVQTLAGSFRRADEEHQQRVRLEDSELRYRALAETVNDLVFVVDGDGRIEWASPSVTRELGWPVADLDAQPMADLLVEQDREKFNAVLAVSLAGDQLRDVELRARTSLGSSLWLSVGIRPWDHGSGVRSAIVGAHNIHDQLLLRRASAVLLEGSQVLSVGQHETVMVKRLCEVVTRDGEYALAWSGRKSDDELGTVERVASSGRNAEVVESHDFRWKGAPFELGPLGRAVRFEKTSVIGDIASDLSVVPWREAATAVRLRSCICLPVRVGGRVDGALQIFAEEADAFTPSSVLLLESLAAALGVAIERLRDRDRLDAVIREQILLSTAIDQSGETILVTDLEGVIRYANPAVRHSSGYDVSEVIGKNPRMFKSGLQGSAFYEAMWSTLLEGRTWKGTLVNRRKDGSSYEEEVAISPVFTPAGYPSGYVAVKHDLSGARLLEAQLSREERDRAALMKLMRGVRPGYSVATTSTFFCQTLVGLDGIDGAALMLLHSDGSMIPLASSDSVILRVGETPTFYPAAELLETLESGPVLAELASEAWPRNPEVWARAVEAGVKALVYVPVRWEGRLTAVLILGSRDSDPSATMETRLGFFEEVGSLAGMLLGSQATSLEEVDVSRQAIQGIVENKLFEIHFQPIVNLDDGRVVGFDALTRFSDDVPPGQRFAEARRVGSGVLLETVCARAAVEAADALAPDTFIGLRFSPSAILDGRIREIVARSPRRVVIVMDHLTEVLDYDAIRSHIRDLDGTTLAVDDNETGYSSLNRMSQLAPEYVKLDISVVRDIDTNSARRAIAAGLCHFAHDIGAVLIAEGVETPEEAETLRDMGVIMMGGDLLAQGYFFGRPASPPPREAS